MATSIIDGSIVKAIGRPELRDKTGTLAGDQALRLKTS
jgi:hypothetical protein